MPCICKAIDAPNSFFTNGDYTRLSNDDKNVYLFNGCEAPSNNSVKRYIRLGEENGIDKRYLTASRKPWYSIEKRPPAPIWVSVFNRSGLRFIRNEANIYNLTTFHCVYPKETGTDINVLFAYLITDVAKEIFLDNSRQYGNGLIKFEPNDLNKGLIVDLDMLSDDDKLFVKDAYLFIHDTQQEKEGVSLLNEFFSMKYSMGISNSQHLRERLKSLREKYRSVVCKKSKLTPKLRVKQLNFLHLYEQYADNSIIENDFVREDTPECHYGAYSSMVNLTKNVLVCLVKKDNEKQYLEQTAKIYYTGKKFPESVALNKLYYFMPYLKGRGIRDLYLIKIARVGYRKEGQEGENINDMRLVFEIEFITSLFDDYKPIELDIWHTFTDTNMEALMNKE